MVVALVGNAFTIAKGHGGWLVWDDSHADNLENLYRKVTRAYLPCWL